MYFSFEWMALTSKGGNKWNKKNSKFYFHTPVQLNKYETDPYFLQIFQSDTTVCLIIFVFCKSCEPICEPEITPVLYHHENQNKNNFTFSIQFTNLTKCGNKHCRALEILKKIWICLTFIYLAVNLDCTIWQKKLCLRENT
jgi:hypothetical protein